MAGALGLVVCCRPFSSVRARLLWARVSARSTVRRVSCCAHSSPCRRQFCLLFCHVMSDTSHVSYITTRTVLAPCLVLCSIYLEFQWAGLPLRSNVVMLGCTARCRRSTTMTHMKRLADSCESVCKYVAIVFRLCGDRWQRRAGWGQRRTTRAKSCAMSRATHATCRTRASISCKLSDPAHLEPPSHGLCSSSSTSFSSFLSPPLSPLSANHVCTKLDYGQQCGLRLRHDPPAPSRLRKVLLPFSEPVPARLSAPSHYIRRTHPRIRLGSLRHVIYPLDEHVRRYVGQRSRSHAFPAPGSEALRSPPADGRRGHKPQASAGESLALLLSHALAHARRDGSCRVGHASPAHFF